MKKKYKYVSYVYGGFDKIHDESIKYKIPLLNHDENCFLCKKKNKKNSENYFFSNKSTIGKNDEVNKKINNKKDEGFFSKFFRKNSENDNIKKNNSMKIQENSIKQNILEKNNLDIKKDNKKSI